MIKKLTKMRETNGLELELEEVEPTIRRKFRTKFEIPNEYSENILITTATSFCQIGPVRLSVNTRLEANFKREYKNVAFLFSFTSTFCMHDLQNKVLFKFLLITDMSQTVIYGIQEHEYQSEFSSNRQRTVFPEY